MMNSSEMYKGHTIILVCIMPFQSMNWTFHLGPRMRKTSLIEVDLESLELQRVQNERASQRVFNKNLV